MDGIEKRNSSFAFRAKSLNGKNEGPGKKSKIFFHNFIRKVLKPGNTTST